MAPSTIRWRVPMLRHLYCELKHDDLFKSALLLSEILSLHLKA